jgi:hypothetical protein
MLRVPVYRPISRAVSWTATRERVPMPTLQTAPFNATPLSVEALAMQAWQYVPLSLVPNGSPLALGASPCAPMWTFTPLPQRAPTMPARILGSFSARVATDTAVLPVCQVARYCRRSFVPLFTLIERAKSGAIRLARMSKWTKPTRMPPSPSANKESVSKVCLRMQPFCATTRITLDRLAPAKPLRHPTLVFPVKQEPVKMGSFRIPESRARKLEEILAVGPAPCHKVQ